MWIKCQISYFLENDMKKVKNTMLKKRERIFEGWEQDNFEKKRARKKTSKKNLEREIQNKRKIGRKQITNGYEGWCGTRNKGGVLS